MQSARAWWHGVPRTAGASLALAQPRCGCAAQGTDVAASRGQGPVPSPPRGCSPAASSQLLILLMTVCHALGSLCPTLWGTQGQLLSLPSQIQP